MWEKFREAMLEVGRNNSPAKKKIAAWAKGHALAAAKERQIGGSGAKSLQYFLAKKVLGKVKALPSTVSVGPPFDGSASRAVPGQAHRS